jgi:hypothetical protein
MGNSLETVKAALRGCCSAMENRLRHMQDPFFNVVVAMRIPGSENITFCHRDATSSAIEIKRTDIREISLTDARSTTIEDLQEVASGGASAGGARGVGLGVKSGRRVVDLEEEREERERQEEQQRRRAADKHSFLGEVGSDANSSSVRDIKIGCGVNPEALQASRERAEDEEGHENPDELYSDDDAGMIP